MGLGSYLATPRDGPRREFIDQFRQKVQWTGLDQYRKKNAYENQQFVFENDDRTVYSPFKSDSGWGEGDAMRGPHVHVGVYDEFQDASKRSFNAGFYEVIDQELAGVPYFPTIFVMGTPKMEGSFFDEMWRKSDQREWMPDKSEHGAWVPQDDPESYGYGDQEMEVRGWHIDQLTAPLHSAGEIEAKRDLKEEQEFQNEVLATFYSPEDHLLSERHLDEISDPELGFVRERRYEDSWVTVGIDWGGGEDRQAADTVIVVMEHVEDEDGGVTTFYDTIDFIANDLSKDDEFERLEQYIIRFDPERVVVDEGYASKRREDLQRGNHTMDPEGYPDLVVGLRFGNISNTDKIKWKDAEDKDLATADKSHMTKSFVDFVKSDDIVLPTADINTGVDGKDNTVGTQLYRQLTAPYEKKKETPSGRKKTTITSDAASNDDAFDASVYAWMGYHIEKLGPTNSLIKFISPDAPGC
jgi:hypothetical protein